MYFACNVYIYCTKITYKSIKPGRYLHAEEKGQMSDLPWCLVTSPSFQDSLSTESVLALCPLLITKGSCQRQTWNFVMPQPTPAKRGLEHIPLTHRYNPRNEDFTVPGNAGTVCIECFFDFFKGNLKKKSYLRSSGHKRRP